MINRNFKNFKFQHKRNQNQVLFTSQKIKGDVEVLNLIDNFLNEKIALFLNLLKRELSKVDIQYLVKNQIEYGNSIIINLIQLIKIIKKGK